MRINNRISQTGLAVGLLVGLLSNSATAAPRRIRLRHGSILLHGYLRGFNSRAAFVFHGHKGQHIRLITTQGGPTVIMVKFPNGESGGGPGGTEEVIPQTGDCRITVTEHHMGDTWRGPFTLKVTAR